MGFFLVSYLSLSPLGSLSIWQLQNFSKTRETPGGWIRRLLSTVWMIFVHQRHQSQTRLRPGKWAHFEWYILLRYGVSSWDNHLLPNQGRRWRDASYQDVGVEPGISRKHHSRWQRRWSLGRHWMSTYSSGRRDGGVKDTEWTSTVNSV